MRLGTIVTTPNGFTVYKNAGKRASFYQMFDRHWGRTHIQAVQVIARHCFGTGVLKKSTSTELPCPFFTSLGWTRATCPIGEASVEATHYEVWSAK